MVKTSCSDASRSEAEETEDASPSYMDAVLVKSPIDASLIETDDSDLSDGKSSPFDSDLNTGIPSVKIENPRCSRNEKNLPDFISVGSFQ